jgi:hypothetical protein
MRTGRLEYFLGRAWRCTLLSAVLAGYGIGRVTGASAANETLQNKQIAVVVFAQNQQAEPLVKTAQTRMEEILADNEIAILDEEKSKELTDIFTLMDQPGVFVTPQMFAEHSKKFGIEGMMAIYLSVDIAPGLADFFSATAHADVRFIDNATAQVRAISTNPMGSRGSPPSEGITRNSAAINAVQRAVDGVCTLMDFPIEDRTRARSMDLTLTGPELYSGRSPIVLAMENDESLWPMAPLENQTWRKEEVSCTARSSAGEIAAVAGYVVDTDFRRRPPRLFGSRIHVLDVGERKSILTFDCSPVEMKSSKDEPRTKKILACSFIGGWRYLCAATGNHLFMWDIEKGREIAKVSIPKEARGIAVVSSDSGSTILVSTHDNIWQYRIIRSN